jgi:glucosamine 6-phosphate synthetase-like amidotransferase/phosphosugar isomerase protein
MKKLADNITMTPVIITDIKEKQYKDFFDGYAEKRVFQVPKSGYLSALLCVIPLQRLAYDLTLALKYDPDKPRNLAKELTTK